MADTEFFAHDWAATRKRVARCDGNGHPREDPPEGARRREGRVDTCACGARTYPGRDR